ncbi:hypothetical protein F7R12_29665 [Pseudomonas tolaasii]|nr:hypothetical protein F7R12_29665 [Pseudomonas tolaasii]
MSLLWRASLLALGCEAALKPANALFQANRSEAVGAAAQPSASKLARHNHNHNSSHNSLVFHTSCKPQSLNLPTRACKSRLSFVN